MAPVLSTSEMHSYVRQATSAPNPGTAPLQLLIERNALQFGLRRLVMKISQTHFRGGD